ncbi:hypothetical protein HBB16_14000 [Pseudonocardia sp. MCCB 268]|nr:hypothetical protein [Pseudonocardia cytotoxica]
MALCDGDTRPPGTPRPTRRYDSCATLPRRDRRARRRTPQVSAVALASTEQTLNPAGRRRNAVDSVCSRLFNLSNT